MQYDSDYSVRLATLGALGGDTTKHYDSVYEIDLAILEAIEQGGGGGGGEGGAQIDDSTPSRYKVYSSQKVEDLLALKQAVINDLETIRSGAAAGATALQSVPSGYPTTTEMETALSGKQDTLSAGTNITINGNTISATDTTYTAGSGITITNNVIAMEYTALRAVQLTQAQYDALTTKDANTLYIITDAQ